MFQSLRNMTFAGLLCAAALLATPIPQPVFSPDGIEVAPVGQTAFGHAGESILACANDNTGKSNDLDFNDICAVAAFHNGFQFTLSYLGSASSLTNHIGVFLQPGYVDAVNTSRNYSYIPGLPTIFTILTGDGHLFYSGSGIGNPGGVPAFYIGKWGPTGEDTSGVPEPSTAAMASLSLVAVALLRRYVHR